MGLPRSPVSDQEQSNSKTSTKSLNNSPQQVADQPALQRSDEQPTTSATTSDVCDEIFARFTADQELQRQSFEVLLSELESRINEKVAEQIRAKYDPLIQDIQRQIDALIERLDQSQCSTSQPDHPDQPARQPAHLEQVVHKLTDFTQQQQDKGDSQARQQKQKNAVLRSFAKPAEETPESLQGQVDDLFCKVMGTSVTCASAKRISTKADAAQGLVVVQFRTKEDKKTVFQARGKLRGNPVGMDDDLTHLQQKRKNAAWPALKDARASGKKTQWRAEKIFILEGGSFLSTKCSTSRKQGDNRGSSPLFF
ncbi:TPA: hypothetical protein ACH3X1_015145 [Trebouxia sp. C0004]